MRTAIAFTKGMQRIQLSQIVRRTPTKLCRRKSAEMVLLRQFTKDRLSGTFKIGMMRKAARVLDDIHRPQLSSPLIEITEQMTMNCLQMRKIERARNGVLHQFVRALRDELRLGLF